MFVMIVILPLPHLSCDLTHWFVSLAILSLVRPAIAEIPLAELRTAARIRFLADFL